MPSSAVSRRTQPAHTSAPLGPSTNGFASLYRESHKLQCGRRRPVRMKSRMSRTNLRIGCAGNVSDNRARRVDYVYGKRVLECSAFIRLLCHGRWGVDSSRIYDWFVYATLVDTHNIESETFDESNQSIETAVRIGMSFNVKFADFTVNEFATIE